MSLAFKAAILGFAATAVAHGTVTGVNLNGVFHQGFLLSYYYAMKNGGTVPEHIGWYAENLDNGFIDGTGYDTANINCHKNAKTVDASASIPAGGKIDWLWTAWPASHVGPVITYVSAVDDYATATPEAMKWVKIDAAGYDTETKTWAASKLIANNNTWTTTVPTDLKPGKYVFRHEIIALHSASQLNGAQNYPQCLNIEVTGSGTSLPAGVPGTSLYKNTDAGIKFDVYTTPINYPIPGPALAFAGGADAPSGNTTTPVTPAPATSAEPANNSNDNNKNNNNNAAAAAPTTGSNALPKSFTMDTFITWLKANAGGASKERRHARQF